MVSHKMVVLNAVYSALKGEISNIGRNEVFPAHIPRDGFFMMLDEDEGRELKPELIFLSPPTYQHSLYPSVEGFISTTDEKIAREALDAFRVKIGRALTAASDLNGALSLPLELESGKTGFFNTDGGGPVIFTAQYVLRATYETNDQIG